MRYKIRKQWFFMLVMIITSFDGHAHQPDLSTAVLSKTDTGKYILQITTSLSAFEGEIDYLYSKEGYKTPEDFKKLVVDHFHKNVFFIVNEKDTLKFGKPLIILGHESKLIVEILNIPKKITAFYFKNTMFKDMPHNQMAMIMLVDGFPKAQYVLENTNEQTVQLELKKGTWIAVEKTELIIKKYSLILFFLLLLTMPWLYVSFIDKKHLKTQ
ncbi:MAG: hypothetical protein GZ091_18030 [Paludibacter sp.]|nr:hypothetical protein [Paludibacter sp.]